MKSKFSIQVHYQKRKRSAHWDLRVLSPNKSYLLSFAIPKKEFPKKGEKVLAIRTVNHKVSYMLFHGFLDNGDSVEVYDNGECENAKETNPGHCSGFGYSCSCCRGSSAGLLPAP